MDQAQLHSDRDRNYLALLLLCLGALLAFRLLALKLAKIDLVLDEAQYWTWGYELAFGYYSKPPLVAWVIRAATELCGDGEVCVRATSPVLHTVTSILIFATARALYGPALAFWSAIVFATMPGVSYSSFIINTDVPLLTCWALALLAWVMLLERKTTLWAVVLGVALGFGLLAKYAMIYFLLCVVCHAVFSRDARQMATSWRGGLAVLIALALIAPNLLWNYQTGFVTFFHTTVNAGWKFPYVHLAGTIGYLIGQAGVFGPIFFAVLFWAAWQAAHKPDDKRQTLLLSFSVPVIVLITMQALLSRAHANWSAGAYPAAAILVTAFLSEQRWRLFRISLWLNIGAALVIGLAPAFAPQLALFESNQALSRVLGWRELAAVVRKKLDETPYGSILVPTRELASELLYYMRESRPPLFVWRTGTWPAYHYEMTRPFTVSSPEPVLFVSLRKCPRDVLAAFDSVTDLGTVDVPIGTQTKRTVHFCRLEGFRKPDAEKSWQEPPMRMAKP
jgi:4-amino-4-deoxy-L-arabinose transferase-like glycosyltransferase